MRLRTSCILGSLLLSASACVPVWEGQARDLQRRSFERPVVKEAQQELKSLTALESPESTKKTEQAEPVLDDSPTVRNLEDLVAFGLKHNPTVKAQYARIDQRFQQIHVAGTLPAPRISISPIGDMAQTATGEIILMSSVSQQFPAFGALSAEVAKADAQLRAAEAALHGVRVAIAADIRKAWWNWYVASQSKNIVDEQLIILQQLERVIIQRIEAGRARHSDGLRVALEINRLRTMLSQWAERILSAEESLRSSLSLEPSATMPQITLKVPAQDTYKQQQLIAAAQMYRSDILANQAQEHTASAMVVAANARHRPNFGVSFSYNMVDDRNVMGRTAGDDQWWFGASMSLPMWFSSYSASDRQAIASQEEAMLARMGIDDVIIRDVRTALSAWDSAHEQLYLYAGDMREQALQAYAAEQGNYVNAVSTYIDVIQAWKQVLLLEMGIRRLRSDVGKAEAAILQAAGVVQPAEITAGPQ